MNPDNGLGEVRQIYPKAADVIYGMLDLNLQRRRVEAINDLAREKSALTVLRGMSPRRVEAFLREKFAEADVDGSGGLDDDEMLSVLRDAAGGAQADTETNIGIIAAADDDGDGVVDYNELAGLVYQTVKHMAREALDPESRVSKQASGGEESVGDSRHEGRHARGEHREHVHGRHHAPQGLRHGWPAGQADQSAQREDQVGGELRRLCVVKRRGRDARGGSARGGEEVSCRPRV